ncbi:ABC transporter ATP-binding protein [Devosia algicola]|uniref:ABC transporter ATP-binding protein n=1 Tax=Devosia algicola TaxID=3026418 RepID=A0ABY7YTL4_9HYPH|nr:ABC transporter ATP-binding protein [Devosia algicola]WDR04299.1 ABC transporter ATP-binding protein [Devosia algicola]
MTLTDEKLRQIRGNRICMIFQDPMSTLNPVYRVGRQIAEGIKYHRKLSTAEAMSRAIDAMRQVGIPTPEARAQAYPHELSGGMQQRASIAAALAMEPDLLIADEPTTALDPTIQSQILDLMSRLKDQHGTALILVTHNLAILAEIADRIAVMYAGSIIEIGNKNDVLDRPKHPYTKGLMDSIPTTEQRTGRLYQIPGAMPSLANLPTGCKFIDRCQFADPAICSVRPKLTTSANGQAVACHKPLC